jgi:peptidyl-prolyl cis-trans isomerase C
MQVWWQTVFLIILLLSGCVKATSVTESNKPAGELQENSKVEIAGQKEEEAVLASVNGEEITVNEYNEKLTRLSAFEKARYRGEAGHKEFLNALIRQKLMVQKAKEMELDKDEDVRRKIDVLILEVTEKVLVETLVEREVIAKTVVTDKEAKAYYDEHKDEFNEKERVRVRHILVATEEEAQKILQELEAGADFVKLAESKSIDENTATRGGDLGYFERGRMVPEFEQVSFDLQVGEISDIVKTTFGYHIIKLDEKQEASVKEFYEISDDIKEKLLSQKQQEEYRKWLNQLEKEAKLKIDEDFFQK